MPVCSRELDSALATHHDVHLDLGSWGDAVDMSISKKLRAECSPNRWTCENHGENCCELSVRVRFVAA